MDNYRFLTLLLLGMSVSACSQFTPYRTQMPAVSSSDSQPEYFECAVDSGSLTADRNLCEDPHHVDSHAIQHRYYTGSFKPGKTRDEDPLEEGDYYQSFVEFDDQGWFADRRQMEALLALLKKLRDEKRETLIYVYAHGWKHNANSCDNNVVCFSRLLERTDIAEKKVLGSERVVVGVYLGWRGLPYNASVLTNLSFWSRKDAAARVGRGGVFELLVRLNDYRNSRQGEETDPHKTQLMITGHSFGGLVIYSALSHALMERAAKTSYSADAAQYGMAKSFGDFVMLVNPAFEGSLYEPLYHIATNRGYVSDQRPVTMIVTSEADSATRVAFPAGRALSTLLQHAKSPEQARSMREAIGHDPRYQTHQLKAEKPKVDCGKPIDTSDCGCPHLQATAEWDQKSLLGLLTTLVDSSLTSKPSYGEGVCLTPVSNPKYPSRYPFLVVKTDERVIADHNAIYNERFINFTQSFFINHIARPKSWTVQ